MAAPENYPAYFNPTFVLDFTPPAHTADKKPGVADKLRFTSSGPLSVDDYIRSTFDYLNRRLGLNHGDDYTLKPMIGFDLVRSYEVTPTLSLTPEIYAVYRYDAVDDNMESRLLAREAIQAGFALGVKTTDMFSATLRFDSDLKPGARDHRLLLAAKYRW